MEQSPTIEQQKPQHIEPLEATRTRLLEGVAFTGETHPDDSLTINYLRRGDGWNLWYGGSFPEGAHSLDPTNADDRPIVDEAVAGLPNDAATIDRITKHYRWWEGAPRDLDKDVEERLLDQLQIKNDETGQSVDILNCSAEALTTEEQKLIADTFQAVANFTGGKVFERVRGLVLSQRDRFEGDTVGAYMSYAGIVRINMDQLRELSKEAEESSRYDKYLGGGRFFEAVFAHELGHAMDITSLDQAEKAGIQTEGKITNAFGGVTHDFSLFDEQFGWTGGEVVQDPNQKWVRDWKIDPAHEIECREFSPTNYGTTNPKEDFAETFAIMSLGGKRDSFPLRAAKLAEGLQTLYEAKDHGPTLLQADYKPEGSLVEPILPTKISVKAAIVPELLAQVS